MTRTMTHSHSAERAAVLRIARANFEGKPLDMLAAVADAIALVPVRSCDGCGQPYLQEDGRRSRFCSDPCRFRIAQREHRKRLAGTAWQASARASRWHPPLECGRYIGHAPLTKDIN